MRTPWLTIIGIGEDGLSGLSSSARVLLDNADYVLGGARHLAMLPNEAAQHMPWLSPFADNLPRLQALRGSRVCVLASGDPMWFGVGATLMRVIAPSEMTILPQPGAFSLAAARMGWALQECLCLTIHGRPVEALSLHFHPGARLLVLSDGRDSPAAVAALLAQKGWLAAEITVLEHMGGMEERTFCGRAGDWACPAGADLNVLAIELGRGPCLPRVPGLPDDVFQHDGQLTKHEVRAVTLSALAPWPGAVLWDVGAGCGSIAIEWARAGGQAVAIERDDARLALIAHNAAALGVPQIQILAGSAPECLDGLKPEPDAIFIGGGLTAPGVLDLCWSALKPGGHLVANAVTTESEALLLAWQARHGGMLTRLAVSRLKPVGGFHSWQPLMPVTQLVGIKA